MSQAAQNRPNTQQIAYWNDETGPKWVALQELLDEQIAPLGLAAMERAAVRAGERVLDVGCGCGQTSLQLAERVGANGSVSGVDISAVMLERARERAAGLANVAFTTADAQIHGFEAGHFDLVFSRFGVMFFEDPVAAFANLHSGLAAGGRLAFVAWQELGRNPWMLVPVMAVAPLVELPPPPPPGAPGPFAFADAERVKGILAEAGFESISIEPLEGEVTVGGSGGLDQASDFVLQMGPAGRVLSGASAEILRAAREAVREALNPFSTPDGVRMKCAAQIVTARRSDRP
jgi:SAM-dependent methyltransferase